MASLDGIDVNVSVERAAAQSIVSNTTTPIQFDTVDFDSGRFVSSDPSQLVVPVDGKYRISMNAEYNSIAASDVAATMKLNGATVVPATGLSSPVVGWSANLFRLLDLAKDDILSLDVFHTAGGNQDWKARASVELVERVL